MQELVEARLSFALCSFSPLTDLPSVWYIQHLWQIQARCNVFDAVSFSKEEEDALLAQAEKNQSFPGDYGQASAVQHTEAILADDAVAVNAEQDAYHQKTAYAH
jgi:hypothetical protein